MKLWRISQFLELDGAGGLENEGRWNSTGRPIVYTAESSALAMLELMVHMKRVRRPPPFQLLEIEAPDTLAVADFGAAAPDVVEGSRTWGDAWLRRCETALAKVPSVIAPKCFNYLINPAHSDAGQAIVIAHDRYPWDVRLFR